MRAARPPSPPPPPPPRRKSRAVALVACTFAVALCVCILTRSSPSPPPSSSPSPPNTSLVVDGVFWSPAVEALLPLGYTPDDGDAWTSYVRRSAVAVRLTVGCGRMQNRLATFADGQRACVRYRQNTDQIQGELFSYYLARLLGLRNLVPSAVEVVDATSPLWARLGEEGLKTAQWRARRPVVLTRYVPDLVGGGIPPLVRPDAHNGLDRQALQQTLIEDAVELAQWSDLIVFDYLTANLDRVVNNLYNRQWNTRIMDAPAHNLAKRRRDGLLVFLDNESGLLHGYRLLRKYEPYHGMLLDELCVFRRETARRVAGLRRHGDVGGLLNAMYRREAGGGGGGGGVRDVLPALPERSARILAARVRRVHDRIGECRRRAARAD